MTLEEATEFVNALSDAEVCALLAYLETHEAGGDHTECANAADKAYTAAKARGEATA